MPKASSALKSALRVAGALLILAALAYFVSPVFYTHVPESRRMAAELYEAARPLRGEIAEAVVNQGSLQGVAGKVRAPAALKTQFGSADLSLTDAGTIRIRSAKPQLTINMMPRVENHTINWQCSGTPEADMPQPCRTAK